MRTCARVVVRLSEAMELFSECLAEKQGLLGAEHESVADTQNNMAIVLRRLGAPAVFWAGKMLNKPLSTGSRHLGFYWVL